MRHMLGSHRLSSSVLPPPIGKSSVNGYGVEESPARV